MLYYIGWPHTAVRTYSPRKWPGLFLRNLKRSGRPHSENDRPGLAQFSHLGSPPFSDGLDNHSSVSSLASHMTTLCEGAGRLASAGSLSSLSGVTSMVSSE